MTTKSPCPKCGSELIEEIIDNYYHCNSCGHDFVKGGFADTMMWYISGIAVVGFLIFIFK